MKKTLLILIFCVMVITITLSLFACGDKEKPCDHVWVEATCSEAKHCEKCGLKEGETLDHTWDDTVKPNECSVCGKTRTYDWYGSYLNSEEYRIACAMQRSTTTMGSTNASLVSVQSLTISEENYNNYNLSSRTGKYYWQLCEMYKLSISVNGTIKTFYIPRLGWELWSDGNYAAWGETTNVYYVSVRGVNASYDSYAIARGWKS